MIPGNTGAVDVRASANVEASRALVALVVDVAAAAPSAQINFRVFSRKGSSATIGAAGGGVFNLEHVHFLNVEHAVVGAGSMVLTYWPVVPGGQVMA
jgi:hypothetical protein